MQFIVQGYPAFAYTGGRPFAPKEPAVVFIHGGAFDHSVWQWQSRYLANHGFTVLVPDLPGHGRSPGTARLTIGDMADWVAALLDAAGLASAAVVGHSMGSLVALETALKHPKQVTRLALVGTEAPMAVSEPFLAAARDNHPAGFDMEITWGLSRGVMYATSPIPGTSLFGAGRALNGRARDGVLAADLAACNAIGPRWMRCARSDSTLVVGRRPDAPLKAGTRSPPRFRREDGRWMRGTR